MKSIPYGDTIDFTTTAKTPDGTSITNADVTLSIWDSLGSNVLTDTISHVTDGTYSETKSTVGWALGPVLQKWTVKVSSGTKTRLAKNQLAIIDSGTLSESYVYVDELEGYFPDITDYLDNKSEDHVLASYKYENSLLESLGYHTPIAKNSDGFYDQSLRDFNAYDSIHRIVNANQISRVPFDEEGKAWYDKFKVLANQNYDDWKTKKITFQRFVSAGEAGIGPATRTQGSSVGTLVNNSEVRYGQGFRGADYTREWQVTIIGTGTSGGIRECLFSWSKNGGLDIVGTCTTSDDWIGLDEEVYVRFTRGTSTGTSNLFVVDDKWIWTTQPIVNQKGGSKIAIGY